MGPVRAEWGLGGFFYKCGPNYSKTRLATRIGQVGPRDRFGQSGAE